MSIIKLFFLKKIWLNTCCCQKYIVQSPLIQMDKRESLYSNLRIISTLVKSTGSSRSKLFSLTCSYNLTIKTANTYAMFISYQAPSSEQFISIYSFDPHDNQLRYVVPPFLHLRDQRLNNLIEFSRVGENRLERQIGTDRKGH